MLAGTSDSLQSAPPLPQVTLIFSAKDVRHNNAVVLRDFLMARLNGQEEGGQSGDATPAGERRVASGPKKKRGQGCKRARADDEARNKKGPRKG